MTLGVGATGLMVAGGPPHGIPVVQARLHVGGMQGTGHPTGLQPEKPGGNLTPIPLYNLSGNLSTGIPAMNPVFNKFSNSCTGLGMVLRNLR